VRIADRTGARSFNALYGQRVAGVSAAEQDRVATQNLSYAARQVAAFGGTILIEPLARGLNGSYPLLTAADVMAVIARVPEDNVKFLFDSFHLASNGEDLGRVLGTHAAAIGHVQIADVPGRGRPGTGALDFEALFGGLTACGYTGFVALEYQAQGPTSAEFLWMGARI
ncbi:MAG: TIM barrel protein, partial [Streptosporangiaceae bacterium]